MVSFAMGVLLVAHAAEAAGRCKSFRFSGEVRREESFRQVIGTEVAFFVDPSGADGGGWTFEIGPIGSQRGEDRRYIYLVTPPWRSRHPTMLDTSYATRAQDVAAPHDIDFWFVFSPKDAENASSIVDLLLWGSQATDQSLTKMASLPMGKGTLRILNSDFTPGTAKLGEPIPPELQKGGYPSRAALESFYGVVRRISFSVDLVVPHEYVVPQNLRAQSSDCPAPWENQWPGLQR